VYSIADRDGDGYLCSEECDDAHAQSFPGNPESCDGLDNDCDGTADGFATACGIGACAAAGVCAGGSDTCVPGSPTAEICDGLDNDCDGALPPDEGDGDGDKSVSCADCDDADPDTFPGAPEVNDGIDNQCSGDPGFGLVDEISGLSGFTVAGDPTQFCWPAQAGASTYEVIRSAQPDFTTGCLHTETSATCWSDTGSPASGSAAYYLVRALTPGLGSWGADGAGAERVGLCGE
jgi:putative metal-binding protein